MKNLSIAMEEQDLKDLEATAKRMALPPSTYARSLLVRTLRVEIAKMDVRDAEALRLGLKEETARTTGRVR